MKAGPQTHVSHGSQHHQGDDCSGHLGSWSRLIPEWASSRRSFVALLGVLVLDGRFGFDGQPQEQNRIRGDCDGNTYFVHDDALGNPMHHYYTQLPKPNQSWMSKMCYLHTCTPVVPVYL